MIDLHCHYLPFVDDGPRDLEAALRLARAAADNGIRIAVLTPHVFPGRWENTRTRLKPHFAAFRRMVAEAEIPLNLRLGGEVRLSPEALTLFEAGELPKIGRWRGRPVILVELPDGHLPAGAMTWAEALIEGGAVPMIAHPERNKAVMRSVDSIRPFVDAGCLLQLTAASICGGFGKPAQATARALLDAGWVTAVATDAHNLGHRPPVLREARDALQMRWGRDAARLLTAGNPAEIVGALRRSSSAASG